MFREFLEKELESIEKKHLLRERVILPKGVVDFSSNDYLGLKDCKETKKALREALDNLSLSSGASALMSGYTEVQAQLEEELARLKDSESCLVVGSGYLANVGLIPALAGEGDTILSDQLNHASIIDGIRLSKAKKVIYRHNDLNHLEDLLKRETDARHRFIITDGVFSMEGDIAPLKGIKYLADRYNAVLVVDDAHGTGVIGEGRGSLFHHSVAVDENIIQMGTLSKALGSYGAFICGSKLLIKYLINKMRTQIFSTALSPVQNFISLYNTRLIQKQPFRRERVLDLAEYTVKKAKELGIPLNYHGTPIITLITGTEEKALYLKDRLLERGFFVQAIRPPTVPKNTSRLRITLNYSINRQQIDSMLTALKEIY
ncbi:MAG: 8-amino-7-oxononanoate synthase [Aquificae bacterium]|nr:8-amino-7-oxononanoate synthase [Aquificota bacterium]